MRALKNIILEKINPTQTNSNTGWIFVVIKPGFLHMGQKIIEIYNEFGWSLDKTRTKQLLLQEAKKLYAVHKKEDFYKSLCNYMSSGPSMGLIFKNPMFRINKDMFNKTNDIKDIIRKEYGESDMRNVIHSSDSYGAMLNESSIYF